MILSLSVPGEHIAVGDDQGAHARVSRADITSPLITAHHLTLRHQDTLTSSERAREGSEKTELWTVISRHDLRNIRRNLTAGLYLALLATTAITTAVNRQAFKGVKIEIYVFLTSPSQTGR